MRSLLLFCLAFSLGAADYDLLIRNARVIDGTGNPWFQADVAVKAGRIAVVGVLPPGATADRTIDAQRRVLAPGFIDVHTHVEGGIDRNPRADNFLRDGVTTVVTGNCGGSELEIATWFAQLEKAGLGINLATLVGHNTVRNKVMGSGKQAAGSEQLRAMERLIDQAMREGAVGFSTGLEYVPGMYVAPEEIIALARIAAKYNGIYTSHMRDEGNAVLDSMEETIRVGREAGIRVQISHLKQDTPKAWGSAPAMLDLIEKARQSGIDVTADQYPYTRSSTGLTIRLPGWALEGGRNALLERLAAPDTRARVKEGMLQILRERGIADYGHALVASFPQKREWEGKTIKQINVLLGRPDTPEAQCDTIFEILKIANPSMIYEMMSDSDVDLIMKSTYVMIASDGGVRELNVGNPHPRSYGTNARVLSQYVRERKLISLEDAIRKMTSLPARTFNFRDRGQIAAGFAADLVLFDPSKIKDASTYIKPHAYSEGFALVVVNGKIAVENDQMTGARPGRALRNQ
ncbi:MAG: D-aminoacylase [Bryobacteraceae bacterium]|nr:D-aminoacylase [Bryobacteraceae bacterium]